MLFSDIVGSTRLLERLGDDYADLLEGHRMIVRRAVAEHDGCEINTAGDGFFVVFPHAVDAVRAAIAAQRRHASTAWPKGGHVRVRMGLHSGEPRLVNDDYVGIDVHRAARICAIAQGGQVLISETTKMALGDHVIEDVRLRDLGERWLKGLSRPLFLHEIVAGGLRCEYPPLRALVVRTTTGRADAHLAVANTPLRRVMS